MKLRCRKTAQISPYVALSVHLFPNSACWNMSVTASQAHKANLKSGTVYRRTSKFLDNNAMLDPEPSKIESENTITNPYTNKKKRRYIDLIGDALCPSLSTTTTGRCYNKLRKLEQDLDVSITKKHHFISNQLQSNHSSSDHNVTRILRLECFNTFHPHPHDPAENKWDFKLQTKLFHPKEMANPISANHRPLEYLYYHPLQAIISRIEIKLDPKAINDNVSGNKLDDPSRIEWNNPNWNYHAPNKKLSENPSDLADGFSIARNGNTHCKMDIFVYLSHWFIPYEHDPKSTASKRRKSVIHCDRNALCKVSRALGDLLGLGFLSQSKRSTQGDVRYHSKSEILQCLGHYCCVNRLIRRDHSMAIDCDAALEAVLGSKTVYSANLWKLLVIKKHILSPDPIHIQHEIRVSGPITDNAKIYDITVKLPSLVALRASKLMEASHDLHVVNQPNGMQMNIDALNVQISDVFEEIRDQMKEKALYQEYAKDPVSAIDVMVSNQRENLQIIKEFCENAGIKSSDYFANSSIYGDIKRYLENRQLEQKRKERTNAHDNDQ